MNGKTFIRLDCVLKAFFFSPRNAITCSINRKSDDNTNKIEEQMKKKTACYIEGDKRIASVKEFVERKSVYVYDYVNFNICNVFFFFFAMPSGGMEGL